MSKFGHQEKCMYSKYRSQFILVFSKQISHPSLQTCFHSDGSKVYLQYKLFEIRTSDFKPQHQVWCPAQYFLKNYWAKVKTIWKFSGGLQHFRELWKSTFLTLKKSKWSIFHKCRIEKVHWRTFTWSRHKI